MKRLFLLLPLAVLAIGASACNTTPSVYVASNGNDSAACTKTAPCKSFQRAYDVAGNDSLVFVKAGTYPSQTLLKNSKSGGDCVSAVDRGVLPSKCVVFMPDGSGDVVVNGGLSFGSGYANPGPEGVAFQGNNNKKFVVKGWVDFTRVVEVGVRDMKMDAVFMTGGNWVGVQGSEIGPYISSDGGHPEVQRVYKSSPLIVPQHVRFDRNYFHDINTTHPTAHVDCLQVENGTDIKITNNTWARCGSVDLRMSYGSDSTSGVPTDVLIENNLFGDCADTPVSQCYYSAQLGVGKNVTVRNNTTRQMLQGPNKLGSGYDGFNVKYVNNIAQGVSTCSSATWSHNVMQTGTCGASDKKVSDLGLDSTLRLTSSSPALGFADPADFAAKDVDNQVRPQGGAPDAGADER